MSDQDGTVAAESTARLGDRVTLERLNEAFQEMLAPTANDSQEAGDASDDDAAHLPEYESAPAEVTPRSILEAILFVGSPENEPITRQQVAELVRGVAQEEVPGLVEELNASYEKSGCPYEIQSVGSGYRLCLREAFESVRQRFYGKIREARLSQAAVEVLALVAYNQPITSDKVSRLRGHPSAPIVSQLVRRRLLRMERPEADRRTPVYFTTPRFLKLFGLESVEELPRTEDVERQ